MGDFLNSVVFGVFMGCCIILIDIAWRYRDHIRRNP